MSDAIARLRAENEELRETVRQLRAAMVPETVAIDPSWRLTRTEARMFRHLASRDLATRESLELAMFSHRMDEPPNPKTIDIYLCKLRAKTERHGVAIVNVWGEGWRLVERERFLTGGAG